jgi:hypothetical protein
MKRVMGVVLATMVIAGTAWAGEFGPAEPLGGVGTFSLGTGYWLDHSPMKLSDDRLGTRSDQYFLQGDYTFLKDWEVYGRIGSADMIVHSLDTQQHFSDSGEAYGTLGLKGVLYRYNNFAVGPFIEGSWYGDHKNVADNQWDANVGVSAQYKIPVAGRDLTIYGGPFAYLHQADSAMALNPLPAQDDMKERYNGGGFLGLRIPVVREKLFLTAEAQAAGRLSTGATLSYKF